MKRKWLKTVFTFTGVFIFAILFRVLFIEIYSIPSGSPKGIPSVHGRHIFAG